MPIKGAVTFKMPPKRKFSSTTSLLTNVQKQILLRNEESKLQEINHRRLSSSPSPPALPPKTSKAAFKLAKERKALPESSQLNKKDIKDFAKDTPPKRRVSISTDTVQINGAKLLI